jgi:predicted house-cleaning NTP pyrophosphatase (Maf/HAM1 superfamily)
MTKGQKQHYIENGYYTNGCYEIAKDVFNRLYKRGERSRAVIKDMALKEMQDYCESQGWDASTAAYNIQRYGMKSLMYWFKRYDSTLKD